jgi:hypothetical protein
MMPSHIDLASNKAPNGRLRNFIGREERPYNPNMLAKPSSDLARLILKPETVSRHKNRQHKL